MLLFLRTSPKKTSPAAACRRDAVVRVCLKKRGGGKSFWLSATVLRLFANIKIPSYRKKISPAQAPGHTVFAIQYAKIGGPVPGKVSPGEAWRDRPLLKRRGPPRSSLTVGILRGGSLQGLLLVPELSCIAVDGVLDDTPGVIGAEEAADVGLFVFQLFIDRKEMHDFIKQM